MTLGRRLLIMVLTVLMVLGFGVGWSRGQAVENVRILMPAPFVDATASLVDRFNADHQDRIHLSITRGPLETESISDLAISSLLLGDPPFDSLLMDVTWLPKYAEAGWLEPLDRWFDSGDEDALIKGARLGNSYKDHLYRWPLVADVGMLYWRTDLMKEPPSTPDQLIEISERLQADGSAKYGFVWQGRQYEGLSCDFLEIISGFGGYWLNSVTGQPELDSAAANQAAQWMESLLAKGISPRAVTNFAESETLQAFKSGDAALMRNWPYAFAELQKDDSSVRGKVGITTMVAEPGQQPRATLGSWGLSLLKGSPHQDATVEAIRFLTSESAQRERFMEKGYTPTQQSLFTDPALTDRSPVLPDIGKALDVAIERPPTPLYAQLSDVLQRRLSAVLTGEQPVQPAMDEAQASSEVILKSAGGSG